MPRAIDYNSVTEPLAQSMNMVASHMLRKPQIRYRLDQEARKLANDTMVSQAQAGNYNAQADGHRQKARGDQQRNDAFDRLNTGGGIAKLHGMISGTTPFNPAEYDQAMQDFTLSFGVSGRDAIALIKQGAQAAAAKSGTGARANAEATGDITSIANNDADNTAAASRGYTLGAGGKRFDSNNNLIAENPSAASQREGEFETTTQEFPAVEGDPGEPATPAVQRSFMGIDALAKDTPANPGRPAVKGAPAYKVTTKKRIGDFNAITAPEANQTQDPDDASEDQEEPTGMEDDSTPSQSQPALMLPKPATFGVKGGNKVDAATAKALLDEVGGDKEKARELARKRGYSF